jgi:hypothetical protein
MPVFLSSTALPARSARREQLSLLSQQEFTKTANCWGVGNNAKGTNTNRIVVLRRM